MLSLRLESTPEAERYFSRRLFLVRELRLRCPDCAGTGREQGAVSALRRLGKCPLCSGRGRITFDVTF